MGWWLEALKLIAGRSAVDNDHRTGRLGALFVGTFVGRFVSLPKVPRRLLQVVAGFTCP